MVHVDHGEVGLPVMEDGLRLGEVAGRPDDEDSVVQCQLDQVHDKLSVVQHERAAGVDRSRFLVLDRHAHREPHPWSEVPGGPAAGDLVDSFAPRRSTRGE